jgi:hypothetical protein
MVCFVGGKLGWGKIMITGQKDEVKEEEGNENNIKSKLRKKVRFTL